MTFNQLYRQLLQRNGPTFGVGRKGFKSLLCRLGNPHLDYPIIHVAGTNGKGSVCHLTASVLQQAHHKTGLFISPHLFSPCERISIDGKLISKKEFVSICQEVLACEKEKLNFFEILTAAAFLYFSRQKVNFAVFETGLGGKKDPTNVSRPIASVITSIGLDHCDVLGNTLTQIAREKAGIIKPATPVFIAELPEKARKVIIKIAFDLKSPLTQVRANYFKTEKIDWPRNRFILKKGENRYTVGILGEKQPQNAALVYRLCRYLGIEDAAIKKGFSKVKIKGRFEVLKYGKNTIVFDGAHNPQAAESLIRSYQKTPWCAQAAMVCGFMKDKEYLQMLKLFSKYFKNLYITSVRTPRAATLQEIKKADFFKQNTAFFPIASQALQEACRHNRIVFVSGSFYLVASLRTRVGARKD
ncbi:MAG: bifunctional folylpolyglutamate synthase/dihydrofolate synthase [Elusimicrobiaceae bacterium]|nr:bifunctional folylpolyglutamate synthase/dihydrofolate synthase [Elusimicrobiaceae bacterium]